MKIKFFILLVLFLGIGAASFAQTATTAPADKKDGSTQVTTTPAKTGECTGHQEMGAKSDCKWVDANGDGKCDTCGKTEKECKAACGSETKGEGKKEGCSSSCPMHKECTGKEGSAPPKDGKK
jgi:hypothetical protein